MSKYHGTRWFDAWTSPPRLSVALHPSMSPGKAKRTSQRCNTPEPKIEGCGSSSIILFIRFKNGDFNFTTREHDEEFYNATSLL